MKTTFFITTLFSLLLMCACTNQENSLPALYELRASELKKSDKDVAEVIKDIEGYKNLFKEEESSVKCEIDFKKNDLIVCKGTSNSGIASITKDVVNVEGTWLISVEIIQSLATVMQPWCVAYVVPKNGNATKVKMDVRYEQPTVTN